MLAKAGRGTIPLRVFWNARKKETTTAARPETIKSLQRAGYKQVGIAGHILVKEVRGTVPLKFYTSRLDNFLVVTKADERDAKRRRFRYRRIEGYAYPIRSRVIRNVVKKAVKAKAVRKSVKVKRPVKAKRRVKAKRGLKLKARPRGEGGR